MSQELPLIPGIPTIGDILQQQQMMRQYSGLSQDQQGGDYKPTWWQRHMHPQQPAAPYGAPFPQQPPEPIQSPIGNTLDTSLPMAYPPQIMQPIQQDPIYDPTRRPSIFTNPGGSGGDGSAY